MLHFLLSDVWLHLRSEVFRFPVLKATFPGKRIVICHPVAIFITLQWVSTSGILPFCGSTHISCGVLYRRVEHVRLYFLLYFIITSNIKCTLIITIYIFKMHHGIKCFFLSWSEFTIQALFHHCICNGDTLLA